MSEGEIMKLCGTPTRSMFDRLPFTYPVDVLVDAAGRLATAYRSVTEGRAAEQDAPVVAFA